MSNSSALSGILQKVSFVNKWPILLKATSDDEQPTPGYLFQEINQLSLTSGSYCQDLLDCLTERLTNPSYHVKLKAIRILRFVIENGHPEFRHGLRKNAHALTQATKFSGPPDPLHGMAPYIMIRKEAKELCQVLFDVNDDDKDVPQNQSAIKEKVAGGIGSEASGSNGLQGFGNTPATSKSPSLLSSLRDLAEKVTLENHPNNPVFSTGQYTPLSATDQPIPVESGQTGSSAPTEGRRITAARQKVKGHVKGQAGGGWEEEEEAAREDKEESGSHSTGSSHNARTVAQSSSADWKEENSTVQSLILSRDCVPSHRDLSNFTSKCGSLNCDKVIELLNASLDSETQSILMRAMLGLEALLRTDLVNPDHVTSMCADHLISIYNEQNGPVKQKARKVLRILQKLSTQSKWFENLPPVKSERFAASVEKTPMPATTNTSSAFPFLYNR